MNINKRKIAYKHGFTIDELEMLKDIMNGESLGFHKVKQSLIEKRVLTPSYFITKKGKDLIKLYDEEVHTKKLNVDRLRSEDYYKDLHILLKNEIARIDNNKGSRKVKIKPSDRSEFVYLCSATDLYQYMQRALKKYPDMTDINKIEKCLLAHCNNHFPLMKYFIYKGDTRNGESPLYTQYCNIDDDSVVIQTNNAYKNII